VVGRQKAASEVPLISRDGKPKRNRAFTLGALCIVILAVAGTFYWYRAVESGPARAPRAAARAGVPVTVAVASRQDVPIYLTGIGTVQAYFTVDIHAKVDGELQEVLFTEGQRVKKGDVLAKIDPRLYQAALDQIKAKRAQDAATPVAAEKDLARAKALALKSFDTQQNVDQLQAKVDQVKASILADEALIETAQTQFDWTTIVAPNDGRIGIRLLDPGNMVRASDSKSLATLVLNQPSAVLFTLPATSLGEVREAMKRGPVEVTAFDQNNRIALATGKLLLIDNVIDQGAAAIRLKALFPNDDEALWPGDFVNARMLVETRRNALVVPGSAVQSGPHGLFTWVVAGDSTVEPRPIEVGPATGDVTIIASGLAEGEHIVTAGQYKLQAKAPVVTASLPPASGNVR
jgi:membrane fusion protein, multidrug efflux system